MIGHALRECREVDRLVGGPAGEESGGEGREREEEHDKEGKNKVCHRFR